MIKNSYERNKLYLSEASLDGNKPAGPLGVDIAGYGQMVLVVSLDVSSTSIAINVHVRLAKS